MKSPGHSPWLTAQLVGASAMIFGKGLVKGRAVQRESHRLLPENRLEAKPMGPRPAPPLGTWSKTWKYTVASLGIQGLMMGSGQDPVFNSLGRCLEIRGTPLTSFSCSPAPLSPAYLPSP